MKVFVAFSLLVALAVAAQAYSLEELLEKYAVAKKAGKVRTNAHTATSHSHQSHSQSNVDAARERLTNAAKKSASHAQVAKKHAEVAKKEETTEGENTMGSTENDMLPGSWPGRGFSRHARCDMTSAHSDTEITGTVFFRVEADGTHVTVDLSGFDDYEDGSKFAITINQVGNVLDECERAGPVWDPFEDIMYPDLPSLGELGTIENDADGNVFANATSEYLQYFGPFSVMGRSMVVWANNESEESDERHSRLACCIIGLSATPEDEQP